MKLYFSPGACSLAPHIVLRESGLPFELVRTSLHTKTLADGSDLHAVSPRGQVPALQLDDGQTLTECAVIMQYVADQVPATGLAPAAGTLARYRLMEWLNIIATELHKGFSPLFVPHMPDQAKSLLQARLTERFAWVDRQLADGRPWLMGESFTVADAYLFTTLSWAPMVRLDLSPLAHLAALRVRTEARPAVQAALAAEAAA